MATRRNTRSGGAGVTSLRAQFALAMTIALGVVVPMANYFIFQTTSKMLDEGQRIALADAVTTTATEKEAGRQPVAAEGVGQQDGHVRTQRVSYGPNDARKNGTLYQLTSGKTEVGDPLIVSDEIEVKNTSLLRLMVWLTLLVVMIGGVVAVVVSGAMTKPLEYLAEDVRQIARGNLGHHTRVRGGGEVASVAKAIDRMAHDLREAREAELDLVAREREMEVAGEVREALLPQSTPLLAGYELAGLHVESEQSGGTFHDFIDCDDGSIGVLVCDVSGLGLPGALVGATARSYLRSELARAVSVEDALKRVNRHIAGDMRRGMYVTALYLRLRKDSNVAEVACAGHKLPLVRCSADGTVRLMQPEGIALGFDKGPVFDRALQVQEFEVQPGDRLVLSAAVVAGVVNRRGEELGEKAFYGLVRKMCDLPSEAMIDALVTAVETYADGVPFPSDLSLVCAARTA
ncbi:MAG: SpoIIE family protein phosphatase [Planctomycetes bacterium]|nr:SpoIIE family protein phosphatase [Planctomycetota bacterium]